MNTNNSLGTLFRASQFLSEELPIRLAHRVQDLGELPDGLSEMPSIKKVQDWYAQSFEVRLNQCISIVKFNILDFLSAPNFPFFLLFSPTLSIV